MKLSAFFLLLLATWALAQETEADYQKQAAALFPALTQPGSTLNAAFVKAVTKARESHDAILQQTDWPVLLAMREAATLGITPRQIIATATAPSPAGEPPKPTGTPWVPASGALGAPAGTALKDGPTDGTWAIIGTIKEKIDGGMLITITSRGSLYKTPKSSLVFLASHPDFETLVDYDKVRCKAVLAKPYNYTDLLGAARTVQGFVYQAELH